jgi:hypothetical protein
MLLSQGFHLSINIRTRGLLHHLDALLPLPKRAIRALLSYWKIDPLFVRTTKHAVRHRDLLHAVGLNEVGGLGLNLRPNFSP